MDHRQRGSYSLEEYAGDLVRIVCERCGRRGQYRKETLLARYGADIDLPHLPLPELDPGRMRPGPQSHV